MTPHPPPSRARLTLLLLLCALTFVLYIDRVCISQAVEPIQKELNLSNTAMSYVLMAFTLAYGLFEVPVGRWSDRVGSRAVLTRIAVWWSAFTALTAACTGFWSLLVVRFLFGAGEAGCMPNIARIVSRWYPAAERGRVQGLIQAAALVGGAAAPVVAAYLIHLLTWRGAFVVFGGLGVVWAVCFWLWFRDDPADHASVNPGELALIGGGIGTPTLTHDPIPWGRIATNRSVWSLSLIMIFGAFNSYLYFSWFPKYLQAARDVSAVEAGWLSSLVLAGAALGTLSGGLVDDALRRRNLGHHRRWFGAAGYASAAGLIALGLVWDSPRAMSVCASLSCATAMSTLPVWWSAAMGISGKHLGSLFGLMNGAGVFGAMGSQFFFGAFADWRAAQGHTGRAQWDPAFAVYVVALLLAALCWASFISRPVEPEEPPGEAMKRGEDATGYS